MTDLSTLLNPEQLAAATAGDGPLLILAAAGTGKTRTLVYRVAHLVERGVRPWNILLLTFTNRAAREMLERSQQIIGSATDDIWGGTFHSIAYRILRKHAAALGYPNDFRILDGDEQKGVVGNIIRTMGYKAKEFVKKEVVLSLISGARNRKMEFAEFIEPQAKTLGVDVNELLRVEQLYNERKEELSVMDFDDLLVNVLRLFQEHPDILALYQNKFHHVLVDEYQDTNLLQSDFVELVAAGHNNLTVVGDDFQCIYTWRGADFRNIMDFKVRHPQAQIITLERNYRSFAGILELANACIVHNPDQFPKTLRATRPETTEKPFRPRWVELYNASEQSDAIVERLQNAHKEGRRWSDMAILYRSHYQSIQIQIALAQKGIPHITTSGAGVFELAHSKDLLAFFRLAEGQNDPLSLKRILIMMRGIGETSITRILDKLNGNINLREASVRQALLKAIPERQREAWRGMDRLFARYACDAVPVEEKVPEEIPIQTSLFGSPQEETKPAAPKKRAPVQPTDETGPLTPSEATEIFLEKYYRDYLRRTCDPDNATERENDVRELAIQIGRASDVRSFLAEVALLTNVDYAGSKGAQKDRDQVTLSTIHQAKGLEWPLVIIPWAVDGMFPSTKSLEIKDNEEDSNEEPPTALAEERRLFYVAVTRARDDLTLYTPQMRTLYDGNSMPCEPSRFIREVPETLFECIRKYGGGYGGRLSAYGGSYVGGTSGGSRGSGYGGGGYHGSGYRNRFSGPKTTTPIAPSKLAGGSNPFSYKGKGK